MTEELTPQNTDLIAGDNLGKPLPFLQENAGEINAMAEIPADNVVGNVVPPGLVKRDAVVAVSKAVSSGDISVERCYIGLHADGFRTPVGVRVWPLRIRVMGILFSNGNANMVTAVNCLSSLWGLIDYQSGLKGQIVACCQQLNV